VQAIDVDCDLVRKQLHQGSRHAQTATRKGYHASRQMSADTHEVTDSNSNRDVRRSHCAVEAPIVSDNCVCYTCSGTTALASNTTANPCSQQHMRDYRGRLC
jgi:hypothetical protein